MVKKNVCNTFGNQINDYTIQFIVIFKKVSLKIEFFISIGKYTKSNNLLKLSEMCNS